MTSIPRLHFAHLHTAIEEMPRLSAELGGPRLFIKRDDQTGLAFGGNKTRKLEFLVAEAQAQGAKMLISAGAMQSNHCRQTAAAAAKYVDVVSYNIYQPSVLDFPFNSDADVPLLIGEFHFGALDRGLFHTGLVPVANQAARAQAYQEYVTSVLRHPQFVGCHWFPYEDEPVTGRVYDEENYQIGFVDVTDTPYAETITASRAVGAALYRRP